MGKGKQRDKKTRRHPRAASVDELFIVGLDTEWQRSGVKNKLLSFQWAISYREEEITGIQLREGKRPSLADLVQHILSEAKAQELFQHYPKTIFLVSHFSLAELTILADFDKIKFEFDALRGSFTSLTDPHMIRITDANRNQREIKVFLRDSAHITPQGAKLSVLGEIHGIPKVELPTGAIEDMEGLLQRDLELFELYAITDAIIAARHAVEMAKLNQELSGKCEIPVTLGGIAMDFTFSLWREKGICSRSVLGHEIVEDKKFDRRSRKYVRGKKEVSLAPVHQHEALAVEAYHGGRNEAYFFGPSFLDDWIDIDLCGAYSTALASMGLPQWDKLYQSTDPGDFTADILGVAYVRFRFPAEVRFPCCPVRMPNNLVFPRRGKAYMTSPEIQLAISLGATIEILTGIIIPMDVTIRPFESVIAECTRRREEAKEGGDELRDRLYKEIANSLYGKTAQGLRRKRVFDSRSGELRDIPPSRLTQPFLAAYVTGLVRASLGELMNGIPEEKTIISVTTDGFITNASPEQLEACTEGPACRILRETRLRLTNDPTILEIKHRAHRVLCFRTRGQATLENADDSIDPLLAKAGIKPPKHVTDRTDQNAWIIQEFFDRNADSTTTYMNLRTLRKIYDDGGDLILEEHRRRLSMDFDFKRKPVLRWMEDVESEHEHLAFTTKPFESVEECQQYRDAWQRFRQGGRCLKTVGDLRDFEEFLAGERLHDHGLNRSHEGLEKVAMRQFIRRLVRGVEGLGGALDGRSRQDLADELSGSGVAVTVDDLKNAKRSRSKLKAHSIPRTPEAMKLVAFLQSRFPGWTPEEMLEKMPEAEGPAQGPTDSDTASSRNASTNLRKTERFRRFGRAD